MRVLKATIVALAFAATNAAAMARHDEPSATSKLPTIVVTASGAVDADSDQAVIRLTVTTENKRVLPAAEENAKKVAAVLAGLEKVGVKKDELATASFMIRPMYDYSSSGRGSLTGYAVSNSVVVTTARLDAAGSIVDAAVQAGATTIDGVFFGLKDSRTKRDEALRLAVAHARADATVAADAAGMKVAGIRRLMVVGDGGQPGPMPMMDFAGAPAAASIARAAPELMPGEVSVTAAVTVEYELAPKAP